MEAEFSHVILAKQTDALSLKRRHIEPAKNGELAAVVNQTSAAINIRRGAIELAARIGGLEPREVWWLGTRDPHEGINVCGNNSAPIIVNVRVAAGLIQPPVGYRIRCPQFCLIWGRNTVGSDDA